jgi:hypothetical protein
MASAVTAARARPRTITASWYQRTAARDGRLACVAAGVAVGVAMDTASALRAVDHARAWPGCSSPPGLLFREAAGRSDGDAERSRAHRPGDIRLEADFLVRGARTVSPSTREEAAMAASGLLRERDLRALTAVVEDGLRDSPGPAMPWVVLDQLLQLIPGDAAGFTEYDLRNQSGCCSRLR